MSKIHVLPAEGFTVRDHTGRVIPAAGAEVDDSPVVRRRIREGVLLLRSGAAPAGLEEAAAATDVDEEEVIDVAKMTVAELKENLALYGVEFDPAAKKDELRELLSDALEQFAEEA